MRSNHGTLTSRRAQQVDVLLVRQAYVLLGIASFTTKVLFFCWLFMQIRWTLLRFRYDQLMRLGWLGLFPISVANVMVTALVLVFLREES